MATFDTRRALPSTQTLFAEVALLDNAFGTSGKGRVDVHKVGARVDEIEAARVVGTGRHAVPAANASMPVHHDDAVSALPRSSGGTNLRTGRIAAVVAKKHQGMTGKSGIDRLRLLGKDRVVLLLPNPLYFVRLLGNIRDIVRLLAGLHALVAALIPTAFLEVDGHGPALCTRLGGVLRSRFHRGQSLCAGDPGYSSGGGKQELLAR